MRITLAIVSIFFFHVPAIIAQVTIGSGHQPDVSIDPGGNVRVVYGNNNKIYYAISKNGGTTFSTPQVIGEVTEMHLGMERGPQLASSKDFSVVTAIDKPGNIHAFQLDHKSGKWTKIRNANDVVEIAKEGLMDLAADDKNNFYAVWLDLRLEKKNNIAFASWSTTSGWSKNTIVYTSPEKSVCECCKPSISVKGNFVAVMFRNWVKGSRDLYVVTSANGGKNFSDGKKLGEGTWKLNACPMDGGGVTTSGKQVRTVWQRDNQIFYAEPGLPESKIANGRNPKIAGGGDAFLIAWQEGDRLMARKAGRDPFELGSGTALKIEAVETTTIIGAWELDGNILVMRIPI